MIGQNFLIFKHLLAPFSDFTYKDPHYPLHSAKTHCFLSSIALALSVSLLACLLGQFSISQFMLCQLLMHSYNCVHFSPPSPLLLFSFIFSLCSEFLKHQSNLLIYFNVPLCILNWVVEIFFFDSVSF